VSEGKGGLLFCVVAELCESRGSAADVAPVYVESGAGISRPGGGSLRPFIQETITPGSTVITDGYDGLECFGFQREIYVFGQSFISAARPFL
jgi:hypothetical protein